MHLSKVFIQWHKAHNPYEIHRVLWQLFVHKPDQKRDFLFRVEKLKKRLGAEILLQSFDKPAETNESCRITAVRTFDPLLASGQQVRFRLRANPIKTIKDEKGRANRKGEIKKCRVPIIQPEQQYAWLERKFKAAATIQNIQIHLEMPLYFRKTKAKHVGKIQTVIFDGFLMVTDPNKLIQTIQNGIGPAKAFGCGLLSLARP